MNKLMDPLPQEHLNFDCDVFIIHQDADNKLVDKGIVPQMRRIGLKSLKNSQVQYCHRYMSKSSVTLVIVSDNFMDSPLLTFESIVALEKCQNLRDRSVMALISKEIEHSHPDIFQIPFMKKASKMILDTNRVIKQLDTLTKEINVWSKAKSDFPVTSVAHGLAWSHYLGYLKIILPELKKNIRSCELYRSSRHRMPLKLYILLPQSCRCPSIISKLDNNIKCVGQLDSVLGIRGGNFDSHCKAKVYRLQDEDGRNYFCVVQYAQALSIVCHMESTGYLTENQRKNLWQEYTENLQKLINFPENRHFSGLVHFVPYKDDHEDDALNLPSPHLLKAVKEDISEIVRWNEKSMYDSHADKRQVERNKNISRVCIQGNHSDISFHLKLFLEEKGFDVCIEMNCEQKMSKSLIVIFILSSDYMTKQKLRLNIFREIVLQVKSKVDIIPLLVDVCPTKIPESLLWVTYIDMRKDRQYKNRILEILRGKNWSRSGHVPAVGVSSGLAWRYYITYLSVVLPGLMEVLDQLTDSECPSGVRKLYGILPKSCTCWVHLGDAAPSEEIHFIEKMLLFKSRDTETAIKEYYGNLYTITDKNDKTYKILAEYVTPVICFKEMLDMGSLTQDDVEREIQCFMNTVMTLLEGGGIKVINHWKFVYYDDSQESLFEALIRVIHEDLSEESIIPSTKPCIGHSKSFTEVEITSLKSEDNVTENEQAKKELHFENDDSIKTSRIDSKIQEHLRHEKRSETKDLFRQKSVENMEGSKEIGDEIEPFASLRMRSNLGDTKCEQLNKSVESQRNNRLNVGSQTEEKYFRNLATSPKTSRNAASTIVSQFSMETEKFPVGNRENTTGHNKNVFTLDNEGCEKLELKSELRSYTDSKDVVSCPPIILMRCREPEMSPGLLGGMMKGDLSSSDSDSEYFSAQEYC
ncbi:hypothetical protein ScPMuIL_018393 [Solemya velum]